MILKNIESGCCREHNDHTPFQKCLCEWIFRKFRGHISTTHRHIQFVIREWFLSDADSSDLDCLCDTTKTQEAVKVFRKQKNKKKIEMKRVIIN